MQPAVHDERDTSRLDILHIVRVTCTRFLHRVFVFVLDHMSTRILAQALWLVICLPISRQPLRFHV